MFHPEMSVLVAFGFLAFLIIAFGLGLWLHARETRRRMTGYAAATELLVSREVASLSGQIGQLGAKRVELGDDMQSLRNDLSAIRADLEWLAGDRMIEQAIQMCRDGLPADKISADCGLSPESLRSLKVLRAH
jgi:hypothetical protein